MAEKRGRQNLAPAKRSPRSKPTKPSWKWKSSTPESWPRWLFPEGQKAPVGSLLAVIATGSENPAEVKKKVASRSQPRAPAARVAAGFAPGSRRFAQARRGRRGRGRGPQLQLRQASAARFANPTMSATAPHASPPFAVPPLRAGQRRRAHSRLAPGPAHRRRQSISISTPSAAPDPAAESSSRMFFPQAPASAAPALVTRRQRR